MSMILGRPFAILGNFSSITIRIVVLNNVVMLTMYDTKKNIYETDPKCRPEESLATLPGTLRVIRDVVVFATTDIIM